MSLRVLTVSLLTCALCAALVPAARAAGTNPFIAKVRPLDVAIGETPTIADRGFLPETRPAAATPAATTTTTALPGRGVPGLCPLRRPQAATHLLRWDAGVGRPGAGDARRLSDVSHSRGTASEPPTGLLTDDEKDVDGDSLSNWDELHGAFTTFANMDDQPTLDWLDPDSDGDGVKDGADDHDHDGTYGAWSSPTSRRSRRATTAA